MIWIDFEKNSSNFIMLHRDPFDVFVVEVCLFGYNTCERVVEMSDNRENMDFTMKFEYKRDNKFTIREVLNTVWKALEEKGYNPSNQLVGYLLSGDPSYITAHNNARNIIRMFERDEILELILEDYMNME